ncbi:MAG TPA: rhomboid family intramembrane serine protease [Desulfuromonadaceae bacterium]|nr:rhomboid family intramembrane serine protease [Desulfuromonadaceae bacterium]
MLENRDYMREPEYRSSRVSFTVVLLIVNAVVFVSQMLASHSSRAMQIEGTYFALSLDGLRHGCIWQLLTFQFMHANLTHIIFNSLAIYFFGRPVEETFGRMRFATLYFCSGVVGGLVQMGFALMFPSFDLPVVGASAGASGLVAAFAVMHWAERFSLIFYFVPITMRGRTLLWFEIGLAVIGMLAPASSVANAAHLGGILTGFVFTRYLISGTWSFPRMLSRKPKSRASWLEMDPSADDFLQKEVDPILEKISAHGIQSLTAREREILEKARSKMDKR